MSAQKVCLLLVFTLMWVASLPLHAEDFNWSGNGDGTTWSDANNWHGGKVPNENHATVIFNNSETYATGTIIVDGDYTVGEIQNNYQTNLTLDGFNSSSGTYNTITIHSESGTTVENLHNLAGGGQTLTINAIVLLNQSRDNQLRMKAVNSHIIVTQDLAVSNGLSAGLELDSTNSNGSITLNGSGAAFTSESVLHPGGNYFVGADDALGTARVLMKTSDDSGSGSGMHLAAKTSVTLNNDSIVSDSPDHKRQIGIAPDETFTLNTQFGVTYSGSSSSEFDLYTDTSSSANDGVINFTGVDNMNGNGDSAANERIHFVLQGDDDAGIIFQLNPENSGDTQSINGKISGVGTVEKVGEGTTTLVDVDLTDATTKVEVKEGTLDLHNETGEGIQIATVNVSGGTLSTRGDDKGIITTLNVTEDTNAGTSGTVTLTGEKFEIGTLNVNAGEANLGGSSNEIAEANVTGTGSLNFTEASNTLGALTVQGGKATLSADPMALGQVTVSGGTLLVDATLTPDSVVTISDQGVLAGEGTLQIASGQSFNVTGGIDPGDDSVGILRLAFDSAEHLDISLATLGFDLSPDDLSDLLEITSGGLDLGDSFGFSHFNFNETGVIAPDSEYILITAADGIIGTLTDIEGDVGGYVSTLEVVNGNQLRLSVSSTVIPEPTTGALLLVGLGLLASRRRWV